MVSVGPMMTDAKRWKSKPKTKASKYPKLPKAWQRACDDIIESSVHFVMCREFNRLLCSREVIVRYSSINKNARSHERATRASVYGCVQFARKGFPAKGHGTDCRCRAYAILAVNAGYVYEDEMMARALFLDSKAKFDTYLNQRN